VTNPHPRSKRLWALDAGSAAALCVKQVLVDGQELSDLQLVEALQAGGYAVERSALDESGRTRLAPNGRGLATYRTHAKSVIIVWSHPSACQTCLYVRRMIQANSERPTQ